MESRGAACLVETSKRSAQKRLRIFLGSELGGNLVGGGAGPQFPTIDVEVMVVEKCQ